MSLRAALHVNAESAATKTVPQISSRLALSDRVALVTQLRMPDWNGRTGPSGTAMETRLHFEPTAGFIDRIEGRVRQDATGVERHSLKLGFSDNTKQSDSPGSLTIKGNAIIEKTLRAGDEDVLKIGLDAIVTGLPTTRLGLDIPAPEDASSSLSLSLRRSTGAAGAEREKVASVVYGHSWVIQDFSELDLKLAASRAADRIEPSIGISWKATF